jgi:transketolase
MRVAFVEELMRLAAEDPNVMLLTGDLGFGVFEPFQQQFPRQFFNTGIAEQAMIGIAAGLAHSGKKVYVYSIGNFPTLRCLEQIRNDLCYHNLNVTIVSQGGGFSYGGLGMSHHATEDLSIMRALPGVTIVAPSNQLDTAKATRALSQQKGVGYLRLEKDKSENSSSEFQIGQAILHKSVGEVALFAIGGIVGEAFLAAKILSGRGVKVQLLELHTLKPLDSEKILSVASKVKAIVTIEENTIYGGLYGAVAETLVANNVSVRVVAVGLHDCYSSIVGEQEYLRKHYEMDATAIVRQVERLVLEKSNGDI